MSATEPGFDFFAGAWLLAADQEINNMTRITTAAHGIGAPSYAGMYNAGLLNGSVTFTNDSQFSA